jgi:ParB family transcriptional regulator, chromosome partitioning protein
MKSVSTSILLSALDPDPSQPRQFFDAVEIDQLAASIHARKLLLPLRVKPADAMGRFVIISGHRRFAALQKLGVAEVMCIVADGPLDEATILAEQIAENVIRQNLTPIEEGQAYHKYIALKSITAAAAAEQLQVSASRISRLLPLLELPSEVQAAVHAGTLSADAAYYLTRLPEGEARNYLMTQALAGTLTRDAAARAAKDAQSDDADTPAISRASFKFPDQRTVTLSAPAVRLDLLIDSLEELLKAARKARSQGLNISTLTKMFRDRSTTGGAS